MPQYKGFYVICHRELRQHKLYAFLLIYYINVVLVCKNIDINIINNILTTMLFMVLYFFSCYKSFYYVHHNVLRVIYVTT